MSVVLQKHQPPPPRLKFSTTPVHLNVEFTIFMGGIGKNYPSKTERFAILLVYVFQNFDNNHHVPWATASFGTSRANMSAWMKVRIP
jgi:hypothetical protein